MGDMPYIDVMATADNIRRLMRINNLKVADIQRWMNFSTGNSVYKWLRGDCLPSLDTMICLCRLFGNITLEELLIIRMPEREPVKR